MVLTVFGGIPGEVSARNLGSVEYVSASDLLRQCREQNVLRCSQLESIRIKLSNSVLTVNVTGIRLERRRHRYY